LAAAVRRWYTLTATLLLLAFGLWPCLHRMALVWWVMVAPWCLCGLPRLPERLPLLASSSTPGFRKTILAAALVVFTATWLPPIAWLLGNEPQPLERSLITAARAGKQAPNAP